MRNLITVHIFLFLWGLLSHSVQAQGAWAPAGADESYPRIMLKNTQKSAVQASLTDTIIRAVYQGLYQNAMSNPPSDNTNTSNQRARATIAQNAAFVYYIDRKYDGAWNPIPLSAAEKDALLTKCLGLLENINTTVEQITLFQPDAYTNWQWRSKMIIHFMCAYDLLKGAGVPDPQLQNARNKLIEYARNLYREANRSVLGFTFFDVVKNNHTLMTTCALGVAAVVLNDHVSADPNAQPVNWLQSALYHTDNVLWRDPSRNSEPDTLAGYAEGTYYTKYWLINGLPFFRGMGHFAPDINFTATYKGNSRSIRNPWYDPSYENIYEWIARTRLPDGKMPPLEDSYWNRPFLELALTGKPQFHWKIYNGMLGSAEHYNATLNDVFDLRSHYVAANTPLQTQENRNLFQALPVSGNLVFRSSWGPEAVYMHVNGQNGLMRESAGGHGQADASAFLCYAYGQHLALDAGYLSYAERGKVINANNHNMILVDGTCAPPAGSVGVTGDADAYIEKALDTPRLDYGKVTTAYCNTQIARHFLFIDGRYFLQSDFISSPTAQSFTWQLHGHGLENGNATTGIFLRDFANNQATWQKQGVSLLAHITAQNQLTQIDTASKPHELGYNNPINHTVLLATKTGEKNTLFVAGLYPYKNEAPALITNLSGLPSGLTGVQAINNGKKEQFYAQLAPNNQAIPPALTTLEDTAFLNGALSFISHTLDGDFLQGFVQNGNRLWVGHKKWMQSQKNLDMALQKLTDSTYYAYASQKDTLHFFMPQPVRSVIGPNVLDWAYNCATQLLSVTLNQGGAFTLLIGSPNLTAPIGNTEICAGLPLVLEAPASTGVTYIWESPLGATVEGNIVNIPQASLEQSGNWKLKALQNNCAIAEFIVSVIVRPAPHLSNLPDSITLCAGAALTLNALDEPGTDYLWRAPDGFETTGATLRRENLPLPASGLWELRAQKGDCQVTQNFTVTLDGVGVAGLSLTHNAPLCQNKTLTLSAPIVAGASYYWQGPNNFTATNAELSFTAEPSAHSGQWRLLMVTGGCTLLQSAVEITVKPLPLAANPPVQLTLCQGEALQINTSAESQTEYYWQGPSGFTLNAPILSLASVTPAAAGSWVLSAEKEGCRREETFTLEVRALPAPPNLEHNAPICSGQELYLSAAPIPNARYVWQGPSGIVSDTPTASHIRLAAQEEIWRLLVTLEQCAVLDTTFTVLVRPNPLPSALAPAVRLCQGAPLALTALGEELTAYTWLSPNLETLPGATLQLENIQTSAAGQWKLRAERQGCLTEQIFQLTVENAPEPPQVFSNAPVCQGATLQFTSEAISGATYSWNGPAGIAADLPNLSFLAGMEHNGNWSLTVLYNECTLLTQNFLVEIYPLPLSSALAPQLTLCPESALHLPSAQEAGTVYTWQGPGNFIAAHPVLSIAAIKEFNAGRWRLKANKNGCEREQSFDLEVVRLPAPPQLTAPAVLCQGETLELGLSPLPEAIYQWRGPGGFESAGATLNLVASPSLHSGTWTAQVTYQGCVVFDTSFTLNVWPLPQTSTLENVYTLCQGASLELQTAQESNANYIFTGPNGFTYEGNVLKIPTVNAATSGVYQLKTEKNGCFTLQTFSLEVTLGPEPPTFTAPAFVCAGRELRLAAEPLPGVLYQWKAPDGSLYHTPEVEIAQAESGLQGAWELLTRYQGCTLGKHSIPIAVRSVPLPSSLDPVYTICQGKTLSIQAASEVDVFYRWEGPNNFTFSGAALLLENISPQASGIWRLSAEKERCNQEQTFTIAVESPPLWPNLPAFQNVCRGQTLELGFFSPLPGVAYQWEGPNGFSGSSSFIAIPDISPSSAGEYTLSMKTAHCQAALQTTTISVKTVSGRFAEQDTAICSGENWRLAFELEGSGPWELEVAPLGKITLGAEGQTGPIILFYPFQPAQSATYTLLSVKDKNGCAAAASGSRKVTVAQPPANLTLEGNTQLCEGDNLTLNAAPNEAGVTYLWQGPNHFSANGATITRPALQIEDAGVYSLTAVIGSCSARIATRSVTIFPRPELVIQSAPAASLCWPAQPTLGLSLTGAAPWQFSYVENGQSQGPFTLTAPVIQLPLNAQTGSYSLSDFQLVDLRGCSAQISIAPINYTLYPPMNLIVESVIPASCGEAKGEATLRATGGAGEAYSYELERTGLSAATGRFTGLGANTYIAIARSGGCQARATFTIAPNAPPQGLTVSAVNGIAFAQWQEVTGSRGYKIRYREVGGNGSYQEVSPIQTNSVSLRGLTPNKTYEIQVQALCADGTPTAWSAAQTYTAPNSCPSASSLQAAPLGATGANVQWSMVPGGAVCYVLSFGKIDTDPNLWQQVVIPYSRNSYLLSGLEPGQRYGVRIRTNCQLCSSVSGVFSPWSEVSVLTTPFRRGFAAASPTLRLWPNPSRGGFWLSWAPQEVNRLSITLFDAQGKTAFRAKESDFESATGATEVWVPLLDLVPGLYTAQILLDGEFRFIEKIIIAP